MKSAIVAVAVLVITSCGGDTATTTEPGPATSTTSTIAATIPSEASTTTTAAPAPTFLASPSLTPPDSLAGSDGAAGSGCAPGAGTLPDGIWFGIAEEITASAIELDLACFFFGESANEAAAEDGVEEIPVPNDYYIRNEVATLRSVLVPGTAVVHSLGESIENEFEALSYAEWAQEPGGFLTCPGEGCLVWIYINGGEVTEVVEQYTP